MKRREFLNRFIPQRNEAQSMNLENKSRVDPPQLSEREMFTKAMELGIDPATVSPAELAKLVLKSES